MSTRSCREIPPPGPVWRLSTYALATHLWLASELESPPHDKAAGRSLLVGLVGMKMFYETREAH